MALNPIACTENIVRSFLRYQLTAATTGRGFATGRDLLRGSRVAF